LVTKKTNPAEMLEKNDFYVLISATPRHKQPQAFEKKRRLLCLRNMLTLLP